MNDVWYSSDGVTWTQATVNAQFPAMDGISASRSTIKCGSSMATEHGFGNDIWTSSDGVTWTQAVDQALFHRHRVFY